MANVSKYVKDKLVQYIQDNLEKGHSLDEIKDALIRHGHEQDIIDDAVLNLDSPLDFEKYDDKLHKKAVHELVEDLREYIKDHKSKGHPTEDIKKHLMNHGHNIEIIEQAIEEGRVGDPKKYTIFKKNTQQFVFPASLLFMAVIIMNFVAITKAPFFNITIAFLPTLVSILLVHILVEKTKENMLVWLVGPLMALLLYVIANNSGENILSQINMGPVMIMNIVLSLGFTFGLIKINKKN